MNYKVFRSVNRLSKRRSSIDLLMILISNNIRYVYILVLLFMWFRNDSYKKVSCNAMISVGVTLLINSLIKLFYFKPRPFVNHRIGILIPSKVDSSFPSKHTILVFALSTSIFLSKRFLGTTMWVLSVITGFSRIWVGHHYPSDIIGSAFIGIMTSNILDKIARFVNYFARQ